LKIKALKKILKKIVKKFKSKFSSFFTSKSTSSKFTSEVPEEIPHEVVESQQAGEMVLQLVRGREELSTCEILNLSEVGRLALLASLQLALEGVRGNLSPPENEYFKSQSQSPGVRERLQRAIEIVSLYL